MQENSKSIRNRTIFKIIKYLYEKPIFLCSYADMHKKK